MVKAFKNFFQLSSVPDGESGQSCGSWSWRGTSMVRGLLSERSYPWALVSDASGPLGAGRRRSAIFSICGFQRSDPFR